MKIVHGFFDLSFGFGEWEQLWMITTRLISALNARAEFSSLSFYLSFVKVKVFIKIEKSGKYVLICGTNE